MSWLTSWITDKKRDPNVLYQWGEDTLRLRPDAMTSFLLTGDPGSGKTSGGQEALERVLFGHPSRPGGVCTVVKGSETERMLRVFRDTKRTEHGVMVGPHSSFRMDCVQWLLKAGGSEMLSEVFKGLGMLTSQTEGMNSEGIWEVQGQKTLRYAVETLRLANITPSIEGMYDIVMSAPSNLKVAASEEWQKGTACGQLLARAKERKKKGLLSPEDQHLLGQVERFWTKELPALGDDFRGGIQGVAVAALTPLLFPPYSTIFASGKTTHTPEEILEHGLILLFEDGMSILGAGIGAQLVQVLTVQMMQRAILRRKPGDNRFFIIDRDECSHFLPPDEWDAKFLTVSRSHNCITIDTAQNYNLLYTAFGGGPKGKSKALAFIGCHGNRFMYAQSDEETCKLLSALCGMRKELMINISTSGSQRPADEVSVYDSMIGFSQQPHLGMNEQWQPNIRPEFFSSGELRTGGPPDWEVDAIWYCSGRKFSNGKPYRRVAFKQVI